METAPRPRSASVRTASTVPAPRPVASARTVPPPLPRLLPPELCRAYGRPWHSYGTDALLTRWSMLRTSIVFGVFWVAWHAPLAGIRGYYQAEVVDEGWATGLNFVVSIFAFVLLMNWVYMRSGRCIGIAVLFHLAANFGNEVLRTDPGTKIIQTAVLAALCAAVLWKDRALFLARPAPRKARHHESTTTQH